jgi:hypothetical protein
LPPLGQETDGWKVGPPLRAKAKATTRVEVSTDHTAAVFAWLVAGGYRGFFVARNDNLPIAGTAKATFAESDRYRRALCDGTASDPRALRQTLDA